ncbi:hypothetical protein SAMN05421736_10241 [Evansella caseinilytica]|uniref:Uncharacterized protein n=1 Tax=Evansella caseinilytica TaxID=1503961 RepID=A0A1H3K3R6_9BACI|nr:hypothetical protein SAMN05421736_10241 [Evansella caseinilytica]
MRNGLSSIDDRAKAVSRLMIFPLSLLARLPFRVQACFRCIRG